jgi:hypothetical protein
MRKWLPLAPAGTAGVWSNCINFIPTRSGSYYAGWVPATKFTNGPGGTPGTPLRAWCALRPTDAAVIYIGTTTKLHGFDGASAWTDYSKGGGYTNTAVDWSFAQYGEISLATNRVDNLQFRDASTGSNFADVGGSPPKSRLIVTQAEQVLLFDLNDGAEKGDAFAVSAPGDYTDWSGSGATAVTRIRHRPGKITAAVAFKDYVLAFKQSSVYKLTYTGGTYKWRVELIAIGRGAFGKHDVINTGDEVIFAGPGGAWRFDGASFRSITDWWGELPRASHGSLFAPQSGNVFFFNKTGGQTEVHAYNVYADAWGQSDLATAGVQVDYIPLTGEPAALKTVVVPTVGKPDKFFLFETDLDVVTNADYWGTGNGTASDIAYLETGVEGEGADVATHFDRVVPQYTIGLGASNNAVTLSGDTTLLMDVAEDESADALMNNITTYVITDRASSSSQRLFDINRTAAYARFLLKVKASTADYTELSDLLIKTGRKGKGGT